MTSKLRRLYERSLEHPGPIAAQLQLRDYLQVHSADFIALIEAARHLRRACDTGMIAQDGSQQGVRTPEKDSVIAMHEALKPFEGNDG